MSFFVRLFFIAWLVQLCCAQDGDYLTADLQIMKEAGEQSWHQAIDVSKDLNKGAPTDITLSYEVLLSLANACFNYIKTKPGMTTSSSQIALVACVGIHGQPIAYCASVPRDGVNREFAELLSLPQKPDSKAPRWETAFRVGLYGDWARAEDYAYSEFEQHSDFPNDGNPRYPDGTTIAVWTSRSAGDRGVGTAYVPCTGVAGQLKRSSCQDVANRLGVTYAPSDPYGDLLNPQGTAQPNPLKGVVLPDQPTRRRILRSRDESLNGFQNLTFKRGPSSPGPMDDDTPVAISGDLANTLRLLLKKKPTITTSHTPVATDDIEDELGSDAPIQSSSSSKSSSTGSSHPVPTPTAEPTPTSDPSPPSEPTPPSDPNPPSDPTPTPSVTPPPGPAPTCYLRGPDPDAGIADSACDCNDGGTYPTLSTTDGANVSEQCAYTSLPASTTSLTGSLGPPITDTVKCQVCSSTLDTQSSCTSLSGCLPQTAEATVTAATSGVHVGALTADALYTSVSSALEALCPPVTQVSSATQCSGTATVEGISYIKGSDIEDDGTLEITVPFSSYNVTSLRDAMISSIATASSSSAAGNNCYPVEWNGIFPRAGRRLRPRIDPELPEEDIHTATFCNSAQLVDVNYYSQFWRTSNQPGATDTMEMEMNFHEPPDGTFECGFLEGLADALVAVAPEFAIEEIELGQEVGVLCEKLAGENSYGY